MKQQKNTPEELLKNVDPGRLFSMTGKFAAKEALRVLDKGSKCFLLALRDVGGETPDHESTHATWGMACRLPGAKAFRLMRNCMEKCGWIETVQMGDERNIILTVKGLEKCREFQAMLKPDTNEA